MRDRVEEHYGQKAGTYAGSFNPALLEPITEAPPLRILDVGCADGALGAELKRRGHEVHGLEISAEAAEIARRRLDAVTVGSVERPEVRAELSSGFDVIIFGDVLEHLFDPAEVLLRMKERLSPRGYFIICVPNFGYVTVRLRFLLDRVEYQSSGILDDGHIRIFNERMLRRMVERIGMRIVGWSSTYRHLPDRIPGLRGRRTHPAWRLQAGFERLLRDPTRRLLWPQFVVKVVRG